MLSLPEELTSIIFNDLNNNELMVLKKVSKEWRDLITKFIPKRKEFLTNLLWYQLLNFHQTETLENITHNSLSHSSVDSEDLSVLKITARINLEDNPQRHEVLLRLFTFDDEALATMVSLSGGFYLHEYDIKYLLDYSLKNPNTQAYHLISLAFCLNQDQQESILPHIIKKLTYQPNDKKIMLRNKNFFNIFWGKYLTREFKKSFIEKTIFEDDFLYENFYLICHFFHDIPPTLVPGLLYILDNAVGESSEKGFWFGAKNVVYSTVRHQINKSESQCLWRFLSKTTLENLNPTSYSLHHSPLRLNFHGNLGAFNSLGLIIPETSLTKRLLVYSELLPHLNDGTEKSDLIQAFSLMLRPNIIRDLAQEYYQFASADVKFAYNCYVWWNAIKALGSISQELSDETRKKLLESPIDVNYLCIYFLLLVPNLRKLVLNDPNHFSTLSGCIISINENSRNEIIDILNAELNTSQAEIIFSYVINTLPSNVPGQLTQKMIEDTTLQLIANLKSLSAEHVIKKLLSFHDAPESIFVVKGLCAALKRADISQFELYKDEILTLLKAHLDDKETSTSIFACLGLSYANQSIDNDITSNMIDLSKIVRAKSEKILDNPDETSSNRLLALSCLLKACDHLPDLRDSLISNILIFICNINNENIDRINALEYLEIFHKRKKPSQDDQVLIVKNLWPLWISLANQDNQSDFRQSILKTLEKFMVTNQSEELFSFLDKSIKEHEPKPHFYACLQNGNRLISKIVSLEIFSFTTCRQFLYLLKNNQLPAAKKIFIDNCKLYDNGLFQIQKYFEISNKLFHLLRESENSVTTTSWGDSLQRNITYLVNDNSLPVKFLELVLSLLEDYCLSNNDNEIMIKNNIHLLDSFERQPMYQMFKSNSLNAFASKLADRVTFLRMNLTQHFVEKPADSCRMM